MSWNAKGAMALGLLATVAVATACTIEVNINTDADAGQDAQPVEGTPTAPTPPVPPPPPSVRAPVVVPPPTVQPPSDAAVRDALFRFRREQTTPRPTLEDLRDGPTFTPFTKAPAILNRQDVLEATERHYPALLRDAGIGGTVRLYFLIDEDGAVRDALVDRSSGHEALDAAALRVAKVYRFDPAMNRDEPVPVWVSFPVAFEVH